ncbi:MAG: two-component system sensor histidine kinase CreC [Opitutaceae bacterium]|nr:two-component system sensor histidine kinase CreC [Opitutaceae bacterium]
MTIRTRLFLLYALVITSSCIGLLWWITGAIRIRYLESMEESLIDTSVILASLLEKQVTGDRIDPASFRDAFATAYARRFDARVYSIRKTAIDLRVYVTDRAGVVIYDSDGGRDEGRDYARWNDVMRTLRGEYGARASLVKPHDRSSAIIHVAAPIRAPDGAIVGVVTVGKPPTYVNQFVRAARQRMLFWAVPFVVLLGLIGWFGAAWITRPLEKLTAHARALRDGRTSTLPRLASPEVHALGTALEEMRDALEGKNYVENYVQSLAHQLKAPLSGVRGAAELLQEDMPAADRARFLANIRAEAGRIQRIVDRMLQLAALEKRKGLEDVERVDLAALLAATVDELRPLLEQRRLTVQLASVPAAVEGERFLLGQALLNLLHNAAEFSPPGSTLGVALAVAGDRARIEILDRGPGVPDYALPRVFERFYSLPRPDTGAKGTGLGLSLVREIAQLHGGTTTLDNRPDAPGARAVLDLPVV